MKKIFLLIMIFIFIACATPAGKFTKDDCNWETRTLNISKDKAYDNLIQGFRICGQKIGIEKCHNYKCDIYLHSGFGSQSLWVLGFVNIEETKISVGINKKYDEPVFGEKGKIRKVLFELVNGNYTSCEDYK